MTQSRLQIPVGKEITVEELRRWTPWKIQNRDLNDPRFAGYNEQFNWHTFLTIHIADPEVASNVSRALDHIAATAEGQQTIRQAYAMQNHRFTTMKKEPNRIVIAMSEDTLPNGYADLTKGSLGVSPFIIDHFGYMTREGSLFENRTWHYSYEHFLYHELSHFKDTLLTDNNWNALWTRLDFKLPESWQSALNTIDRVNKTKPFDGLLNADAIKGAATEVALKVEANRYVELPAMAEANRHMGPYYHEPARYSHEDGPNLSPRWPEWLGKDHVYTCIPSPPPTPRAQKFACPAGDLPSR